MADFRFDPDQHQYFLGDRRLESVTEILGNTGIADYRWSSEEAMLRGTYVHKATEMIDRGTLDWSALDPILLPYCVAYQKFIEDKRPEILLSEEPMFHAQHMYAGTLDRIIVMDGITSLVDLKTGVPHRATAIQVAAYRELVRVNRDTVLTKCFSLHLRDDGTYRLDPIGDLRQNFSIFLAALTVERYKENA